MINLDKWVLFLLVCLAIHSCQNTPEANEKVFPSEFEYAKRAYPDATIDQSLVKKARADVQKIKSSASYLSKNDNTWKNEGPTNIGGRVTDIARHPSDAEVFYIGTSQGGVFKTEDGGRNWIPVFDEVVTPSVGNMAISPSNPDVLYVGTGEANGGADSAAYSGSGIYKSEDGGQTWEFVGLENSQHVGRLVVDKDDPNIVYAAVAGVLYDKGTERGLYKTVDGGENWEKLLFVSDSTAIIDVVVHPEDSNIIYAASWERQRFPWVRDYGGPTSAIFKTIDGGQNWTRLENGLPQNQDSRGRIGLAMSQSNPDVLYASITDNEVTNVFEGVYRTNDAGDNWENVSALLPNNVFSSFGWFFGNMRVDPTNEDVAYVLGLNAFKTSGNGWQQLQNMHVDMHALEFFPEDPNDILIGNDGGLYRSLDGGNTISFISNIPITQFYTVEVDFQKPERIFGGTQDNNTIGTFTGNVDDYDRLLGGDGFYVNVDPRNSDIIYAEYQFGNLFKSIDGGNDFNWAMFGIDTDDRNNWNTPVVLSPIDPSTVFYGSNKLYKSFEAESWEPISEDLTRGEHPSMSQAYGTLTTIAPSYNSLDVIYTGSDDGRIALTKDGGLSWDFIDGDTPNLYVSRIAVNPLDDAEAIVTFSGYRQLDKGSHVMITYDYGQTWEDISNNLPEFPINDIVYNPEDTDELFIGADFQVWTSKNHGETWDLLGKDMPNVIVNDIEYHAPTKTLLAGTYGRSIFSISTDLALSSTQEDIIEGLTLSPNPVNKSQDVTITSDYSESFKIKIYDLSGRMVKRIDDVQNQFSIDGLGVGQYIVQIYFEDRMITDKLQVF